MNADRCKSVLLPLVEQRARVHPLRDSPRHSCRGLIASFPGPCASSGGRLPPQRFSWFFNWIPKLQTCVNLVDLVKRFQTSIYTLVFTCKISRRFSRERASQSFPKICQKLEKIRKSIGTWCRSSRAALRRLCARRRPLGSSATSARRASTRGSRPASPRPCTRSCQRERSVKIKLKIKKQILKIKSIRS